MKIEKFEDINSWQKARDLSIRTYKNFNKSRDYSFRDQIQRAVISIMNNIAEGFERSSNREFKYFLFIAKGSCAEFRSMLYVAHELGYISKNEFDEMHGSALEISRLISGLIKTL